MKINKYIWLYLFLSIFLGSCETGCGEGVNEIGTSILVGFVDSFGEIITIPKVDQTPPTGFINHTESSRWRHCPTA